MPRHDAGRRRRFRGRRHEMATSPRRRERPEPIVAMAFAAAPESLVPAACRQLHDRLILAHRHRLGPVEWRVYDGSYAAEFFAKLGDDRFDDLIVRLTRQPALRFIVASVEVPAGAGGAVA